MKYERVPVSALAEGDRIDLEGDKYADPQHEHPMYPFEDAVVIGVEPETENCTVIHIEGESIGFPPSHYVYRAERRRNGESR